MMYISGTAMDILKLVGFILVVVYVFMGIDDFFWDIFTLARRRSYKKNKLDIKKLNSKPPKLLAFAIAAWHEENVLGEVVSNIIASTNYPKSMYHIFLGVYPNDEPTIQVAKKLEEKYWNVHVVINELPGPTSKAQNINYIIKTMYEFEKEHHWKFASLTIHDSEDVVHPYELLVTNFLIESHDALQFPVFPIMRMPRFRTFFKTITTGTYADEFAENHFNIMVSRLMTNALVPSAGTGFVLSRRTLELFKGKDVLPKNSLTEDYKLSLTLYEKKIQMYYVLEKVPRINNAGKLVWDFISTRSLFPNTFKKAVRQKTRWILGITMQSFQLKDIFKMKGIPAVGRYSLYRDLKAKIGNLLILFGYPIFIYFIISLFLPLKPIYVKGTLGFYLSLVISVFMIERQIFRGVCIYKVYGMRSVFFSCLFPPLFPIRLVWGNIINLVATIRAYKQKLFANRSQQKQAQPKPKKQKEQVLENKSEELQQRKEETKEKSLAWAKTDHDFIDEKVLKTYYRTLGDYLMQKGYITPETLSENLQKSKQLKERLGNHLLEEQEITEEELLHALAEVKQIPYVIFHNPKAYELKSFAEDFDERILRLLQVLPLIKTADGYVIAFCEYSPNNAQSILKAKYDIQVHAVFLSQKDIRNGIKLIYESEDELKNSRCIISRLLEKKLITYEQVILARNYEKITGLTENQLLEKMGLFITHDQILYRTKANET